METLATYHEDQGGWPWWHEVGTDRHLASALKSHLELKRFTAWPGRLEDDVIYKVRLSDDETSVVEVLAMYKLTPC